MSLRVMCCGAAIAAILSLSMSSLLAQDAKKPDAPKPEAKKPDDAKKPAADKPGDKGGDKPGGPGGMTDEQMAEMMKMMAPGPNHRRLDPLVGKWTYDLKWWMAPGGEADTSKGNAEQKWILDGTWLQQDVDGPEEAGMGKKFKGMGLLGYDNMREHYVAMWMDNMGCGAMTATGTADKDGKVITVTGDYADPMTGKKNQKFREVWYLEGKDKYRFEMYSAGPDGKEFKQMEIVYTRAGS